MRYIWLIHTGVSINLESGRSKAGGQNLLLGTELLLHPWEQLAFQRPFDFSPEISYRNIKSDSKLLSRSFPTFRFWNSEHKLSTLTKSFDLLKVGSYCMLFCKWFVVWGFGFLNLKEPSNVFFSEVVMKLMRTEWKWWRSLQCVSLNINHIRKLKNTHFKKIIFRSSK